MPDVRAPTDARLGLDPSRPPRIGILVLTHSAGSTLANLLDRIPPEFRPRISTIFVCDDAGADSANLAGLAYKQVDKLLPLTIISNATNLGYGGNQKVGYRLAIDTGLDIMVLLHGDGHYAPEDLPDIVDPLLRGEWDAVIGSQMLARGGALRNGIPGYKYLCNKFLTGVQNALLSTAFSQLHSGYRAYSVPALASIPFTRNSDRSNFDTQIVVQLLDAGKRITEVPVRTSYRDGTSCVNELTQAWDATTDVVRYRLSKLGFLSGELGGVEASYRLKEGEESSHEVIQRWLAELPPSRILDLGCSGGHLSNRIRGLGHEMTSVDIEELPGVRERVDRFIRADLDRGLPDEVREAGPFDLVLAADVLEHLREPQQLLDELADFLGNGGLLIASVPNFAHWYVRLRTALGLFDYDQRGILDKGHVRFFTRRSFRRHLLGSGFKILREEATGLPLEVLTKRRSSALLALDRFAVSARPTLFGYQFVCQCAIPATRILTSSPND
jgi:2-polyprenyl-3-methyl-5-hydroxy-6-metoxy-1,4-benzoquinol methylase